MNKENMSQKNPYLPPVSGMFHHQTPMENGIKGQYSVYIPSNFEQSSPAVLILPPKGITAKTFILEMGSEWINTCNVHGIVIIVAEAYNGSEWNINDAANMRDDEVYLKAICDTVNKKNTSIQSVFNMDERSFYVVGYEQGASAALKFGMTWPQLFAGLVSIGCVELSDDVILSHGARQAFPFMQSQISDGRETIGVINKSIPLPVWMLGTSKSASINNIKQYWIEAGELQQGEPNEYAQEIYENDAVRMWITSFDNNSITLDDIWSQFLFPVQRFPHEPGGKLEWRIDTKQRGFFITNNKMIDGWMRRWVTYIPTTYDANKKYPLIVACHGGTSTSEGFIGDSKWHETAEKYGIIIVFPQAYPCVLEAAGWIPVPLWNQYIVTPNNPPDDVSFIKQIINETKANYNIDSERVYATGHSNGAGMTWRLGLDIPEYFAAIAPAGYNRSAIPSNTADIEPILSPIPVWVFMGKYDQHGGDEFRDGNPNDLCLNYWSKRNGFDPSIISREYYASGRCYTRTWTNGTDEIPLFRFSTIANLPHIYHPLECDVLWNEFFSKIIIKNDGKRYYEGKEIKKKC